MLTCKDVGCRCVEEMSNERLRVHDLVDERNALRVEVERLREWQHGARRALGRILRMTVCLCDDVSGPCMHCGTKDLVDSALLTEEK